MPSVASTVPSRLKGLRPIHPNTETAPHQPGIPQPDGELSLCRWIHPEKHRYYSVVLVRDLFGDWTLLQCWGAIGSHLGGQHLVCVGSREAGLKQIAAIGKRRLQHGYREQERIVAESQ